MYDVLVIGAGPAGMMCSLRTARRNLRTLLLEKNDFPGKKLLISGSGQCNLTHSGDIGEFFTKYGSREKERFVKPALLHWNNRDLGDFFAEYGVFLREADNGKLFPESGKSRDILNVLLRQCENAGVRLETGYSVQSVEHVRGSDSGQVPDLHFLVRTNRDEFRTRALVIATGGKSYPSTGSTGDGFRFAQSLGHSLVPQKPGLVPVYVKNYPFSDCSGIAVYQAGITLVSGKGKKRMSRSCVGDVLFTHEHLSGPGILDLSRYFEPGDILQFNWLHPCSQEEWERRLLEYLKEHGRRSLWKILKFSGLPERLIATLLDISGLSGDIRGCELGKDARKSILKTFTQFELEIVSPGNYNHAMCTCGGIDLSEVDRNRMESRIVPNLHFCGEVLDVDGDCGGYNLQFAFSSGVLLGDRVLSR